RIKPMAIGSVTANRTRNKTAKRIWRTMSLPRCSGTSAQNRSGQKADAQSDHRRHQRAIFDFLRQGIRSVLHFLEHGAAGIAQGFRGGAAAMSGDVLQSADDLLDIGTQLR